MYGRPELDETSSLELGDFSKLQQAPALPW
jgi:hypothetical protein